MTEDRRDADTSVDAPELGYRASRRSSKGGKRRRREARHKRATASLRERSAGAIGAAGGGLKSAGGVLAAVVAALMLLALVATGINYGARVLATRTTEQGSGPDVVDEHARENLLVIGATKD